MLTTVRWLAITAAFTGVASAERIVAVAPVSVLGVEDKSVQTKTAISQIEHAIAALPGNTVVAATKVATLIDRARKPHLKACEGDGACLAELGKLVGAQIVVTGEVGGLGDAQVIYLGATDVATGKELRSTTLAVGANDSEGGATGAAIRLLDPDKYVGTVRLQVDVAGATVFVDGAKVTPSSDRQIALPVGTHALRVTHPQYHDFIKFVAVAYGHTQDIPVVMAQHPIVEHDVRALQSADDGPYSDPPLYRRWYVAGPVLVALAVGTGLLVAALAHHFPHANECRALPDQACK